MKLPKRAFSFLLACAILVCSVPAMGAEAAESTLTVEQLREKFPDGKYWNHADNPGASAGVNNQDGWTDIPCESHTPKLETDLQTCNGFMPGNRQLSWQCMGYAEKLGYDATGLNPRLNTNGWYTYTSSAALDNVKPGDIVRYRNHSIYVIGVDGDTITYTDCNSGGTCVIRWDETISLQELKDNFVHLRSAPIPQDNTPASCDCSSDYAGTYLCKLNAGTLNIRGGHGTEYAVIGSIPKDAEVTVTKADGEWAHVEYGGVSGYASFLYLELIELKATEPAETEPEETRPECGCDTSYAGRYLCELDGGTLNIRAGHGTEYAVIGSIPKDAIVTVTMANGEWAHVEYDGVSGYAAFAYLEKLEPTISHYGNTLVLEDIVKVNFYYTAEDLADGDINRWGLLVWSEEDYSAAQIYDASTATYTVDSLEKNQNYYVGTTHGIPAKEMGDQIYARAYVELKDGTCVFSQITCYSPMTYARNKYSASDTDAKLKSMLISLANYGAAAQTYFGYRTDGLMNSFLTEKERTPDWSDGYLSPNSDDTAGKYRFHSDGTVSVAGRSVVLEGAFAINVYCRLDQSLAENAGKIGLLYWDQEAYANASVLTAENASKDIPAAANGSLYCAAITDIAAKRIDGSGYACFYVVDENGTCHYSNLVAYNIHNYAGNTLKKSETSAQLAQLVKQIVLYGNCARNYFIE